MFSRSCSVVLFASSVFCCALLLQTASCTDVANCDDIKDCGTCIKSKSAVGSCGWCNQTLSVKEMCVDLNDRSHVCKFKVQPHCSDWCKKWKSCSECISHHVSSQDDNCAWCSAESVCVDRVMDSSCWIQDGDDCPNDKSDFYIDGIATLLIILPLGIVSFGAVIFIASTIGIAIIFLVQLQMKKKKKNEIFYADL